MIDAYQKAVEGQAAAFAEYLDATRMLAAAPTRWPAAYLQELLDETPANERGSLALRTSNPLRPFEVVPGISVTMQVVEAGKSTTPHAHSFWHFYIVLTGEGAMVLDASVEQLPLKPKDIVLIPAWCSHGIHCDDKDDLILLGIQNLPQLADLGSLLRQQNGQEIALVFRDTQGDL